MYVLYSTVYSVRLQTCSTESSEPGSRPLCNPPEPSITPLCSTEPRFSGHSYGRALSGLESVGVNLCVSSFQSPDESIRQASIIQGQGSSSSPPMAEEQLVPTPDGVGTQTVEYSKSTFEPDGANQDCVRFILDHKGIDFMDFLRFAAQRRFE